MRGLKLIGLSLLLAAGSASAQVTGTVTVTSDYDFRGISQSAKDPALQGSVDWADESGFYAGLWGSNVDFGDEAETDVEVDAYVGFAGGEDEGFGYDVGVVYYSYWPDDDEINYAELSVGGSYSIAELKFWYSNDYINSGESAYYIEGNLNFELPQEIGLGLHLGFSDGDFYDEGDSITDYGVSVSKSFGPVDVELKYVDTDLDGACEQEDVGSCEGRIILSASTTFPWSDE